MNVLSKASITLALSLLTSVAAQANCSNIYHMEPTKGAALCEKMGLVGTIEITSDGKAQIKNTAGKSEFQFSSGKDGIFVIEDSVQGSVRTTFNLKRQVYGTSANRSTQNCEGTLMPIKLQCK